MDLVTDLASKLLPNFSRELHYAEQRLVSEPESDDEPSENPEKQEEWTNPTFTSHEPNIHFT